jgi:hypothetical protein
MSLIVCPDCGKKFSDKAKCCPQCGCPVEFAIKKNEDETIIDVQSEGGAESNKNDDISDAVEVTEDIVSSGKEDGVDGKSIDTSRLFSSNEATLYKDILCVLLIIIVAVVGAVWYCKSHKSIDYEVRNHNTETSGGSYIQESTSNTTTDVTTSTDDGEFIDEERSIEECKKVLFAWNEGLNNHDANSISGLYQDMVDYYRSNYTPDQIRSNQNSLFSRNPEFYQYIDNIDPECVNYWYVKISFDKHVRVTNDGDFKVYQSYLCFIYEGDGRWKIGKESDLTTDKNLEKKWSKLPKVAVDNTTPLKDIFCVENVGKYINTSVYNLLDGIIDSQNYGPLASSMVRAVDGGYFLTDICGVLCRNYRGKSNTIYCDGSNTMGGHTTLCVWVYDLKTGELSAVWE